MIYEDYSAPGTNPLFETTSLSDILKQDHPLMIMRKAIDWRGLTEKFSEFYSKDKGRKSLSLELMISILLLKYIFNLSDEDVVAQWKENYYYQAFSGRTSQTLEAPCSSSQLARFRKRIGVKGCEVIMQESVRVHGDKALEPICITDTTVQEKNVAYPTDHGLIFKAIAIILRIANFLSFSFKKTDKKKLKTLKNKINFSKGKDSMEQRKKTIDALREIANSLLDCLIVKLPETCKKQFAIAFLIYRLGKVINQTKYEKNKIYSIHEPQVQCIAKGKADKKYEFGSKVSFTITKNKGIVVGALNFKNNIYDGDTLDPAIKQLASLHNGYKPEMIVADRGYRGRPEVKQVEIVTPYNLKKGLASNLLNKVKNLLRKRTIIEPIIGHLKSDHRLNKNLLKGVLGDTINPLLAAAAFNFIKFARIEYQHLHKPPRSLATYVKQKRMKFTDLPLWRRNNPLF